MTQHRPGPPACPDHGRPTKRATCSKCNAAYMRAYQRNARTARPARAILDRAKCRASRLGIPYSLRRADVALPARCPVLGHPLVVGGPRSAASPALDRINPKMGYETGNVRVISDRANCLKGGRSLQEVRRLVRKGPLRRRGEYAAVEAYMEREALLVEVKRKARETLLNNPWPQIAQFLECKFRHFRDQDEPPSEGS